MATTTNGRPSLGVPDSHTYESISAETLKFSGDVRVTRILMKKAASGTLTCQIKPSGRTTAQIVGNLDMISTDTEKDFTDPFVMKAGDELIFTAASTSSDEMTVYYQNVGDPV